MRCLLHTLRLFAPLIILVFALTAAHGYAEKQFVNGYTSPEGIQFKSNSEQWGREQLAGLYELLLQCGHGEELSRLKAVHLYTERSVSVNGSRVGNYDEKTGTISLFEVDRSPVERTFIHEYGHHFTYYWLMKKEGIYPYQLTSQSLWAGIRELDGYPIRWADKKGLQPSHKWNPGEIMAEDYVLLFGKGYAKKPARPEEIVFRIRQENEFIPPASGLPALRQYWSSISGISGAADLDTPELQAIETIPSQIRYEAEGEATQAELRIKFSSAAVTSNQQVDYAVRLTGYAGGVQPEKMTIELASGSYILTGKQKNFIETSLPLSNLFAGETLPKPMLISVQIWAYHKETDAVVYTPFYDYWFKLDEDFRMSEVPTPFDQQGLRAIFAREGIDRWPIMKLFIDGISVRPKNKPFWKEDSAFVSIEMLSDKLGYSYTYNESLSRYELSKQDQKAYFSLNSEWVNVNGTERLLKKRPIVSNGSLFLTFEDAAMMLQLDSSLDVMDGQLFMVSKKTK
jgi:hypothetical protein